MTRATLTRFTSGPDVTLGLLYLPGDAERAKVLCYTAEDAWRSNARHLSCIPDGDYRVVPRRYHRGGYDAWEVVDVPGRSDILIHRGNSDEHVEGCIVVGRWLACLPGLGLSVARSAEAFGALWLREGGREWRLSIRPAEGLPGARLLDPQQEA